MDFQILYEICNEIEGDLPEVGRLPRNANKISSYTTKKECLAALRKNGYVFPILPQKFQTKDLAGIAVSQNGLALQVIPNELKSVRY